MLKIVNYKILYSAGESEAGKCPVCGSGDLEYDGFLIFEREIEYPWECKDCGAMGKERGKITFDGHEVNRHEKGLE